MSEKALGFILPAADHSLNMFCNASSCTFYEHGGPCIAAFSRLVQRHLLHFSEFQACEVISALCQLSTRLKEGAINIMPCASKNLVSVRKEHLVAIVEVDVIFKHSVKVQHHIELKSFSHDEVEEKPSLRIYTLPR